jgi:hypothetical protein
VSPNNMEGKLIYQSGDVLVSPMLVQFAGMSLTFGKADIILENLDAVSRFIEIIILYETPVFPLFTTLQQQSGLLAEHYEAIKSIIKEPSDADYFQYEDKEHDESLLTCTAYASAKGLSLIYDPDSIGLISWAYGDDFANNLANGITKMNRGSGVTVTNNLLRMIKDRVDAVINNRNSILSRQYFTLDVPIMFGCVIDRVRHAKDIIPVALELRDSRGARAFRQQLVALDEAVKVGDHKVVGTIVDELHGKLRELNTEIKQPTLGLQISFPPSIAIDTSAIWRRIAAIRKPHLLFIDQLYKNSIQSRTIMSKLRKFS